MNRVNLLRMAAHVEGLRQAQFDMTVYRGNTDQAVNPECRTVGCIIGHCTVLGDPSDLFRGFQGTEYPNICFNPWSERFTGLRWGGCTWQYLFSALWAQVDNTPSGAAKRIRYVVEHGLPDNWKAQLEGRAKLSYL